MSQVHSDNGIYYFLGNIPSHFAHARPLYEKVGGTFVVLSKDAQTALKQYDIPVLLLDDRPDLFLYFDTKIKTTVRYLNQHARTVLFYELFDFAKTCNLTKPKKVFLTHGNMLKSYMTDNPHRLKILNNYDYMAALGPYLKRQFIEDDGISPDKLINIGIARTDDVIKYKSRVHGYQAVAKTLGLDASKPLFSYMPTFWGVTSIHHIGKELVKRFPSNSNLVFRPHPQTPDTIIKEYEYLIGSAPNIRYAPEGRYRKVDMLSLFNASSAIIGDVSSVMLESILTDKPLLFAGVTAREDKEAEDLVSIQEIVEFSAVINVNNIGQLDLILANTLARGIDPKIWQLVKDRTFYNHDGTSVKSIAQFVKSLL